MSPAGSSWQHVSAQAAPKAAPSDRLYLKLDGVDGEATEIDHAGDLLLRSFTWSESRPVDAGKLVTKDFRGVMTFDKSSPTLMRKAALRERIAKATLAIRTPLGQDYLRWTMTDILVTSVQVDGTAGQGKPVVTFELNAAKIDLEYRPLLFNGGLGPAVKTGWDAR